MERLGDGTLMEIRKEAAAWLIEMDAEPERWDRQSFLGWLKSSPRHMEEFLDQSALWGALDDIDFGETDARRLLAESGNVIGWPKNEEGRPQQEARVVKRRRWLGCLAAVTLIFVSTVWLWQLSGDTQVLATAVGEQRAMKLPDHSVVHMNTNSRVEIRFTDAAREVRLIQGEALFAVEHDANRPFRVITNGIQVEAIGTQFNVRQRALETIVSVVEGRVAVVAVERSDTLSTDTAAEKNQAGTPEGNGDETRSSGAVPSVPAESSRAGALAFVSAGEQARIAADGTIEQQLIENAAAPIAWRQRQLVFSATPLSEVVAELARYNVTPRLQIEGESLQARQLNGVFAADDPESLIQFLARDAELSIARHGETVVIRSR